MIVGIELNIIVVMALIPVASIGHITGLKAHE